MRPLQTLRGPLGRFWQGSSAQLQAKGEVLTVCYVVNARPLQTLTGPLGRFQQGSSAQLQAKGEVLTVCYVVNARPLQTLTGPLRRFRQGSSAQLQAEGFRRRRQELVPARVHELHQREVRHLNTYKMLGGYAACT